MRQIPILFLGDSPDLQSGLARIGRDLATQLSTMPEFRVGYLGLGGHGSARLPFQQYVMQATPQQYEWGYYSLPKVWTDFSRGEPGIVFTVWDLTRLLWLSCPRYSPDEQLRNFLANRNFQLWGYIPIDSVGAGIPRAESMTGEILSGFDRVLAYTRWGRDVIQSFVPGHRDLDFMPHGLNLKTWQPEKSYQENLDADIWLLGHKDKATRDSQYVIRVGVVATNQSRKNWALMAEVAALAKLRYPNLRLWWHTDAPIRYWNLPALMEDFGLTGITDLTTSLTDQELAAHYRSCSVTLHPGMGEGFGFPIFESLACGTPSIHGNYGGGADTLRSCGLADFLVEPDRFFLDGQFNCKWALYEPHDWLEKIDFATGACWPQLPGKVSHLGWDKLWYPWKRWFLKGLR